MRLFFLPVCVLIVLLSNCGANDAPDAAKTVAVETKQQPTSQTNLDSTLFRKLQFQSKTYFICQANPKKYNIEIFNKQPGSNDAYSFETLLSLKKDKLLFAMNGGMFQEDLSALGLLISNSKKEKSINLKQSTYGNFYLLPNGVFLIDDKNNAVIVNSENYSDKKYKPVFATQSGPMMIIDGNISSHFTKGSKNAVIRNGVGINEKGEAVFAVSEGPVNFYEFAELFSNELKCNNALYLDGFVSQYFVPSIHHTSKAGVKLGVFITVSSK